MEEYRSRAIEAVSGLDRGAGANTSGSHFSQVNGVLPSGVILKERLSTLAKVYGLTEVEESCVGFMKDLLDLHLTKLVSRSVYRGDTESVLDEQFSVLARELRRLGEL